MKLDVLNVIKNPEYIGKTLYVCSLVKSNYARPITRIAPTMVTVVTHEQHSSNAKTQVKATDKALLVKTAIRTGVINYDTVIGPVELKTGRRIPIDIFDNMDECKAYYATLL